MTDTPMIPADVAAARVAAAVQLSNDERLEYQMALIWCSAAADFSPEGQAREGWLKLCKPLIDRQPIEGASRDNWIAWLDDLPLPEGFEDGIAALQDFIAGLPADIANACVAAAYEAAAQKAWGIDAKAFRARYIVDRKGRQRWDEVQVRGCENQVMNIISEDITDAIRELTPADAQAALARLLAAAKAEGMREAAQICKGVRKGAETDYYGIGALDCAIAILAAADKVAET